MTAEGKGLRLRGASGPTDRDLGEGAGTGRAPQPGPVHPGHARLCPFSPSPEAPRENTRSAPQTSEVTHLLSDLRAPPKETDQAAKSRATSHTRGSPTNTASEAQLVR